MIEGARVSVVIVTYRSDAYITQCVAHLRAQTGPPTGILILDDASGDTAMIEELSRQSGAPCDHTRTLEAVITSGNLVRLATLRDAGCFATEFFIDYVDYEFCLRLRRAGWRIIEAQDVVVDHVMGWVRTASVLRLTVKFTHDAGLRRYYKARNQLLIYPRHVLPFPGWMARRHDALVVGACG